MERSKGRTRLSAAAASGLCLLFLLALVALSQVQSTRNERLQMEYIARTVESETYETLLRQMEKTKVLEAHLIETGGSFDSFAPIAEGLIHEDAVRSVIFAPDGIVAGVFPLEGNEPVIGLDMTSEGLGNREAQEAIRQGKLTLAGPFQMVEGGLGVCGRLPVYLVNEAGEREYWGLVTVTLDYPDIFADNPIGRVDEQGYACRVWRINPDDGQEQTVLATEHDLVPGAAALTHEMALFNAKWTLDISALTPWYRRAGLWIGLAGSVLVSLLAGLAVYSGGKVRRMEREESVRQIRTLQKQLEEEQNKMLLSQISSHFFYHTLNALQALIIMQPDAAYKMAGDFSRYLRFNLDTITSQSGIVSFREELRSVRAYADINRAQLGDRLRMVYDVPDADFPIPALTIQPLVENAILHGVRPKVGGGTVTISLTEEADYRRITVADDGLGFDPAAVSDNDRSVGLRNVKKRIAQFPGCSLEIHSAPHEGTTAVLILKKFNNIGK